MCNTTYAIKLGRFGILTILMWCIGGNIAIAQSFPKSIKPIQKKKVKEQKQVPSSTKARKVIADDKDVFIQFVIEDDIMSTDEEDVDVGAKNLLTTGPEYKLPLSDNGSEKENNILTNQNKLEVEKPKVNIFPLPADTYINLTSENAEINSVQLLSTTGQMVLSELNETNEAVTRISVNHLPKGMYFIVMNTTNGKVSRSIIIQ